MQGQRAEFEEERRKEFVPAQIPRRRVHRGELVAEIILDRRYPAIVHGVVQRRGSAEILFLEQFYTRKEAEAAAEAFISDYFRMHPQAKTSAGAS